MENLSLVQIRDFGIVFLALLAFVVLLGNVIKTVKDWLKPKKENDDWKAEIDDTMQDNTERIKRLEDGNQLMMKALIALMNHEINGNSVDKMQAALGELNDYLLKNAFKGVGT